MPRKSRKKLTLAQRAVKHFPELLIGLGLLLLLFNAVHSVFRDRALAMDQQTVAAYQPRPERKPMPKRIYIQWFLDTPVTEAVLDGKKWTIPADAAGYLLQSARPGEGGNIVIYGHNTREILGNIRALKGGERITLTTSDNREHYYRVDSLTEVDPSDTSLIQPTDTEVLTLYTCSGLLDGRRFIVRALPEKVEQPDQK